jgi:succinate dehydrogenase/fumarate reductase flavoprotein subunit
MTEDQKNIMAVFEVRLQDLISLCNERMQKILELNHALAHKDEELGRALKTIEELNAKYDNVLTAKIVSAQDGELKMAKMRLSKLVREVDKCIALLNE